MRTVLLSDPDDVRELVRHHGRRVDDVRRHPCARPARHRREVPPPWPPLTRHAKESRDYAGWRTTDVPAEALAAWQGACRLPGT
jgi:hypothetical protein